MLKPIRIRRSRQHKMVSPNGLPIVYVGRPSKWGNNYKIGDIIDTFGYTDHKIKDNKEAVHFFELSIIWYSLRKQIRELKGKNLACWCPLDKICHGDLLLKIANDL